MKNEELYVKLIAFHHILEGSSHRETMKWREKVLGSRVERCIVTQFWLWEVKPSEGGSQGSQDAWSTSGNNVQGKSEWVEQVS